MLTLHDFQQEIQKINERDSKVLTNPLYNDYNRVIPIGPTGAGKSSLVNILLGKKVISQKDNRKYKLTCSDSNIAIGSGTKSITNAPGAFIDDEKNNIC